MAASSTLNTGSSGSWTWGNARHLLFRAGFGGRKNEIEEVAHRGLSPSLDSLFNGPTRPLFAPSWLEEDRTFDYRILKDLSTEERQKLDMINRQHLREMGGSWIQFMIGCPAMADMLHEKMSFFWHGHFVTSAQKVKATPFIYDQLKLFHDKALGNFGELLHAIIRDPAMLRYLDNDQNRKGKPNENLARELMELFSLGQGNYTEKDIREGARTLTGWAIEPYKFAFRPLLHDKEIKTVLGRTGNLDGDDFVDVILEQPACAEFMARKLWVYFGSENPKKELIQELASKFREAKYDIKTLLRAIFTHPEFYSSQVMGSQIKSPIHLIVGTARTLDLSTSTLEFYGQALVTMGQVPYLPPNVKGWPGGEAWIDTSRLVTRFSFAEIIAEGKVPSQIDPRMKGDRELNAGAAEKSQQGKPKAVPARGMMGPGNLHIDFDATRLIGGKSSAVEIYDDLCRVLLATQPDANEKEAILSQLEQACKDGLQEEALQRAVGKIMLLPAYQLC